jgi:hypothetical protein
VSPRPRRRREGKARSVGLSTFEMVAWSPSGDEDADYEDWMLSRDRWPGGNADTAPALFWMFEGPADLRDPPGGFQFVEQGDAWDRLDDARRAWLHARGGDWRALLEEDG